MRTSHVLALAMVSLPLASLQALGILPGNEVGTVIAAKGTVEVLSKGSRSWKKVDKNYRLLVTDEIRTGRLSSRARVELADRYPERNAGPTILNLGRDTHIRLEDFKGKFDNDGGGSGILDLIRGKVRAFTKNFGIGSGLSVRTGTSLCGIRGSEEVVSLEGGVTEQSCLSGNCFSASADIRDKGREYPLGINYQRTMRSSDPNTWTVKKLSSDQVNGLLNTTGTSSQTGNQMHQQKFGATGSGGGVAPEDFMGMKWVNGLPDCSAEVSELRLNNYRWDDIKGYRNFTFYKDELVNGNFVLSGQIKSDCDADVLVVEVSVDGGSSWVSALYSAQANTFRYEFDPAGFTDLDFRVRPTFKGSVIEAYKKQSGQ